jgi:hypothetical protein
MVTNKPVIGIPYINRIDLLDRLTDSLIHSKGIDSDSVFDFRMVVNTPIQPCYPSVDELVIFAAGHNLGVAASWNLLIKSSPLAPYWLILNSDIQLGEYDLAKIHDFTMPRLNSHGLLFGWGFSAFVITPIALQTIGWFDETIYPAYLEDCDYHYRAKLAGLPCENIPNLELIHGELDENDQYQGSSVIRSNKKMSRENGRTHQGNFAYYRAKWGGINGEETYSSPFNQPLNKLDFWSFDFNRYKTQQWDLG